MAAECTAGDIQSSRFFTGRHHAGETLKRVLENRSKQLMAPIPMCGALARNLPGEFERIPASCYGRCRFVDVVDRFPGEAHYVLKFGQGLQERRIDPSRRPPRPRSACYSISERAGR